MAICTAIELLEAINDQTSILKVTIDDNVTALMLMDYTDALKFLNQEVVYSLRKDVYKQEVVNFIATLTRPVSVNTYDKTDSVKLFCEASDSNSNVSFSDIEEGETISNAVVYCADQLFESSEKAFWCKLTIVDRGRHIASLRLFDPDTRTAKFKGVYVKCDLRKSKYGFTANVITPITGQYPINPEVELAESVIRNIFADDADISAVIENTKLFERMRAYIDYEPGYIAVRTAMELALAAEMGNLVEHIDLQVIKQALLFSKWFIFAPDSKYSHTVINITKSSNFKFNKKAETLLLLDEAGDYATKEKAVYNEIVRLVDIAIKTKKELWSYN
jgi:hypothetical protein